VLTLALSLLSYVDVDVAAPADQSRAVIKGFPHFLMLTAAVDPWFTAEIVGITGHMGTRALFLAEQWLGNKIANTIGHSGL
jgi:hypothetical protein